MVNDKSMKIGRYLMYLTLLVGARIAEAQFITGVGAGNNVLKETEYTSVDGSPYLFNDWKSGAIRDKSGKLSENLMIRYDSYRDEVQFLRDGRTLVVEPSLASEFYFVILNEETLKVESVFFRNGFSVDKYTPLNYFQIIFDAKVKFIKKIKTGYIDEVVNNFGTNEQVKKFVRSEEEFFIKSDGTVHPVNKSRKDLIQLFGKSANEIKVFIKENKLNLKNDADLVMILRRFEELSVVE